MKKIEDLAGSGTKYAGVKVKAEMWGTAELFSTIVYAGEDYFIARRPNKKEACHIIHADDNWYFYDEPKQTVLEPWIVKGPNFYSVGWYTSKEINEDDRYDFSFIRKLTPEELASGKIVLED